MTNVTILGAAGRMGQTLIHCAKSFPDIRIAGSVESDDCPLIGKDAGLAAGTEKIGVKLTSDIRESVQISDVSIDFSSPSATEQHALLAAELGKPMVIGTTGLNQKETASVNKAALTIPIVWAPNMSMGINLLFALVEKAAAMLSDYNIEIIETHHRHKKDAPSGTALRFAEVAASARGLKPEDIITHGRKGKVGERPDAQIGIHAIRAGDIVGEHTVLFATKGERVELTHRASSRECFAMGALKAAEWVHSQKPGLYTMHDVLCSHETIMTP